MVGRTNAGGGKKKKPIIPVFSGAHNFVTSEDGQSGYIEIYESGTLGWTGSALPELVDITCVGAGGGGGTAMFTRMAGYDYYAVGPGGGGGYVNSAFQVAISEFEEVVVGAGGVAQSSGGATSVGGLCAASGGTGGKVDVQHSSYYNVNYCESATAGSGGNYGGLGTNNSGPTYGLSESATYANGGSNGAAFPALSDTKKNTVGKSQGAPTTDILGRIHAGGGAAGRVRYNAGTSAGFAGGASDCVSGSGTAGSQARYNDIVANGGIGGGGHGGGGGGGSIAMYAASQNMVTTSSGGKGGDGFVIIGWGDYLALYEAQKGAA